MYSKFVAILINSAFGLCITYTVFSVYFALTSKFIVERSFTLGFSLYNIVWLVLDIVYNEARYHRQGGGLFFWTSIMLPPILIMLILMLVIMMFFFSDKRPKYNLLKFFFTPKCIFHAILLFHNAYSVIYSVIYGVIVIQIVRDYICLLQVLFNGLLNHFLKCFLKLVSTKIVSGVLLTSS